MSCSPFDLKDYFLQELPSSERLRVDAHVKGCLACREELERLQLTGAALCSLRDEEIPQRIAFVSDQIFEPSALRRWASAFWGSTARLGFASAAMLSVSLIYFAAGFTASKPAPAPHGPAVTTVAAVTPSPEEVQQQIDRAVAKAVAEVEARQADRTRQLVADFQHRNDETLRSVRWMASESEADRKRAQVVRQTALYVQPSASGEIK